MAGAFVTRSEQSDFGTITTQLYDLSGTGAGPFLRVVVCADGAGGIAAGGGGGGGGGGAVYGPTPEGTAPAQAPVYNGYKDGSGQTRGVSPSTPLPSQPYDVRAVNQPLSAALNSFIDIPLNGAAEVALRLDGLTASGATISYFSSNDATKTPADVINDYNAGTYARSPTKSTDGPARIPVSGRTTLRLQVTTAGTGTITVGYNVSAVPGVVYVIGKLAIDQTTPGTTNKVSIGNDGQVAITATDGAINTLGFQADPAATSTTTSGTLITWIRGALNSIGFVNSGAYAGSGNSTLVGLLKGIYALLINGYTGTDRSGACTTATNTFGSVAGTGFIAANSARRFLRVSNPNASGVLYIYDKTGGTPQIGINAYALQPGGSTTYDARVPTDAVQIAGSVANLKYEAAEG